ncbi:MAG: anthrone oxygenase family protein [Methylocystis sp.]|uniref:anthrone oxygenase family protein n=1 Tax=Methylocystis sp. TaxID=1911079 RepID=UPI003D09CBAC
MIIGSLALATAGAFTGASLYINYVEQPARLALSDDALIKEWEPSDHRGFIVLASLAFLAALFGFIAYRELDDIRWLFGAFVAIASWPYTYLAIVPLNNRILALIEANAAHEARKVIDIWGRLEIGQTALGVLATLIYVWAAG